MTAFPTNCVGTLRLLELPPSDDLIAQLTADNPADGTAEAIYQAHTLELATPWRDTPTTELHLVYRRHNGTLNAAIGAKPIPATQTGFAQHSEDGIDLRAPVELVSCGIKKPWGQERWFSGIEARGESAVRVGNQLVPLSHYLALAPQLLCQRAQPLLLKVLDPLPDPVLGDLYFETHDEKYEVYVVTHVDTDAWQEGVGAVRFGLNQTKRREYATDADFRAAYLRAVQNYEGIRRRIDATVDAQSTGPALPNAQMSELHKSEGKRSEAAKSEEKRTEEQLREEMLSFTQLHELRVGDLVQVPPRVPHALQHGVRVFEFQTPVYERNIISFNQRVVTQSHWDSERAIERMHLDPVPLCEPVSLARTNRFHYERIADFADFEVQRINLQGAARWQLTASLPTDTPYLMIAVIAGNPRLGYASGQLALGPGRAAFVPHSTRDFCIRAADDGSCTVLVAAPKPHTINSIATQTTL